MKKFIYLAAALLVMVGCKNNKDVTAPQTAKGVSFKQGDVVTITTGRAQAPIRKVNGNVTSNGVEFTWSDGDKLTITVGSETAQFTLESGAGTKNGVFTGTMPADGETFKAEYKGEYAEDIPLETQTYTENGIDMKFVHAVAENCVVTEDGWSSISLNVDNAAVLIFNLQCDLKIGHLTIDQYFAAPIRRAAYYLAHMSFGDNGLQLSSTTPTKVAILLDKSNLSSTFKPYIAEFGKDTPLPFPKFELNGVAAGDAVDYPLKKWVNLTLPDVATKKQSAQLCALGEKTELNFNFNNSDISDKKLCLKVGDHTIFNKNVSDLWPASGMFADHTFNDANDNNQEYKLHVAKYSYGETTEFTITSAVTEYSLNNTFAVTLE